MMRNESYRIDHRDGKKIVGEASFPIRQVSQNRSQNEAVRGPHVFELHKLQNPAKNIHITHITETKLLQGRQI